MTGFHADKHNNTSAFGPSACQRTFLDLHLCSVLHQKACHAFSVTASLYRHILGNVLEVNAIRISLRACIIDNLIIWLHLYQPTFSKITYVHEQKIGLSSTSSACSITSCRLERVNLLKSTSCMFFLDLLGTSAFFDPAFCKAWSTRSSKSCCLRDSRSPALAAWCLAAPCGARSLTSTAADTACLSMQRFRL